MNRRGRTPFAAFVAVLALTLGMATSTSIARRQPAGAAEAGGPTVRVGTYRQPNTLDPMIGGQYVENYLFEAIFSGLTVLDDRGHLQPDLAAAVPTRANGGISRDGRALTYRLRPNLRWSDGVPLTARDVAFTFERLRAPKTNFPSLSFYDVVERVEAPDARTVVVRLREPSADAPYEIFVNGQNGSIVPEHVLRNVAPENESTSPFEAAPIGSGPYVVERWDRGSGLSLRANAQYFGGPPHVPRLDVAFVPDVNTLAIRARTSEIDLAQLPVALALQLRDVAALRVEDVPSTTLVYLSANLRVAPFDDARVRRAFGLAVDRARLIRDVYHGYADVADDLQPPHGPFHSPLVGADTRTAPARAAALLDAAGWRATRNGMRARNGMALAFALTLRSGSSEDTAVAVLLQSMWRALGADVSLRPIALNVLLQPGGTLARGEYALELGSYAFPETPDRTDLLASTAFAPYGRNYPRYANREVDRALLAARTTTDVAKRRVSYATIARDVRADAPYLPLLWPRYLYAVSRKLDGVKPETANSDFWNVATWRTR